MTLIKNKRKFWFAVQCVNSLFILVNLGLNIWLHSWGTVIWVGCAAVNVMAWRLDFRSAAFHRESEKWRRRSEQCCGECGRKVGREGYMDPEGTKHVRAACPEGCEVLDVSEEGVMVVMTPMK